MKSLKKSLPLVFLLCLTSIASFAQLIQPPKWQMTLSEETPFVDDEVELIFKADIPRDWYIYSNDFDPDLGPMLTELSLEEAEGIERIGKLKPIDPKRKMDETWDGEVSYFTGTAEFRQKVKITKTAVKIVGVMSYQMCSDVTGQCVPYEEDFSRSVNASIKKEAAQETKSAPEEKVVDESPLPQQEATEKVAEESPDKSAEDQATTAKPSTKKTGTKVPAVNLDPEGKQGDATSMWPFVIAAFLGGLAALLTPCVFPMIPMTVTFFTGRSKSKAQGIRNAIIYGLSIIVIYTLAGTIVAAVQGPEFANWLSTHWAPNIFFFLVFIFFALAFLGLFEITLPSGLVNKMDAKADKGGLTGVFFMAFTLVLVSFSCTGPIVGSILIESAGGEILKPILGMFAFSLAFAIPFTLFAIFPEWLNGLPKSGGWLNSVKVVLGFLELALAFKFLSVADQVYHWGLLDRDIYIAIWIVIFALMGLYLLGKIRLPHDSPMEKLGVPRLLLATVTFIFVVYLVPGLFGAPLKSLSGYLPPIHTHDFNIEKLIRENRGGGTSVQSEMTEAPKHGDLLHWPHGLQGYFDYDQALRVAKKENKPLFIDFTGHGCVNCREMEAKVWSQPEVLQRLKDDFVLVALYVDERTELPEGEWYTSAYDDKVKKTIGKQNADFQITRFNNNAQPYYVILDHDEEMLVRPKAYDTDPQNFVEFLDNAKAAFEQ
ncbi:disulfide bond formation protein DsbD [Echinicola strongylocentroti]|uniref:Disulfide bond formation protein DsbD n=1 Tax=Echinicola strongylocentroti TaxID=1795355 RepID=A0A2Z4IJF1_9BACT|nr:cytochrome c biogenesis protein CcdA [Echinicola strongylocentroti]AWW30837.1 disulfide bond formation protein DsbD [Echinicola strongylocentroti]